MSRISNFLSVTLAQKNDKIVIENVEIILHEAKPVRKGLFMKKYIHQITAIFLCAAMITVLMTGITSMAAGEETVVWSQTPAAPMPSNDISFGMSGFAKSLKSEAEGSFERYTVSGAGSWSGVNAFGGANPYCGIKLWGDKGVTPLNITSYTESLKFSVKLRRTGGNGRFQLYISDDYDSTRVSIALTSEANQVPVDGAWHEYTVDISDLEWGTNSSAAARFGTIIISPNTSGSGSWFSNGDTVDVKDAQLIYTQAASTNANLSSLSVNGTAVEGFSADTLSYSYTVPYEATHISIGAVAAQAGALAEGDGLQEFTVSTKVFDVTVTAEDGITKKIYKITVNRDSRRTAIWQCSPISQSVIAGSSGWGSPVYQKETQGTFARYTLTGGFWGGVNAAGAANPYIGASLFDDANTGRNKTVDLRNQNNVKLSLTLRTTKGNGVFSVYLVNDSDDSRIEIPLTTETKPLPRDGQWHEISVALDSSSFPAGDSTYASKLLKLVLSNNNMGSGNTYDTGDVIDIKNATVSADYREQSDASLAAININGNPLGAFSPDIYSYNIKTPQDMSAFSIEALAPARFGSTISGDIGDNLFTGESADYVIRVTASDGVTEKIYTIHVTRGNFVYEEQLFSSFENTGFEVQPTLSGQESMLSNTSSKDGSDYYLKYTVKDSAGFNSGASQLVLTDDLNRTVNISNTYEKSVISLKVRLPEKSGAETELLLSAGDSAWSGFLTASVTVPMDGAWHTYDIPLSGLTVTGSAEGLEKAEQIRIHANTPDIFSDNDIIDISYASVNVPKLIQVPALGMEDKDVVLWQNTAIGEHPGDSNGMTHKMIPITDNAVPFERAVQTVYTDVSKGGLWYIYGNGGGSTIDMSPYWDDMRFSMWIKLPSGRDNYRMTVHIGDSAWRGGIAKSIIVPKGGEWTYIEIPFNEMGYTGAINTQAMGFLWLQGMSPKDGETYQFADMRMFYKDYAPKTGLHDDNLFAYENPYTAEADALANTAFSDTLQMSGSIAVQKTDDSDGDRYSFAHQITVNSDETKNWSAAYRFSAPVDITDFYETAAIRMWLKPSKANVRITIGAIDGDGKIVKGTFLLEEKDAWQEVQMRIFKVADKSFDRTRVSGIIVSSEFYDLFPKMHLGTGDTLKVAGMALYSNSPQRLLSQNVKNEVFAESYDSNRLMPGIYDFGKYEWFSDGENHINGKRVWSLTTLTEVDDFTVGIPLGYSLDFKHYSPFGYLTFGLTSTRYTSLELAISDGKQTYSQEISAGTDWNPVIVYMHDVATSGVDPTNIQSISLIRSRPMGEDTGISFTEFAVYSDNSGEITFASDNNGGNDDDDKTTDNKKTGDESSAPVWSAIMLLSSAGCVISLKKKERKIVNESKAS